LFNATSVVSNVAASCNNFKGYFTVSPTAGKGHFTTVASAINALDSTGGTIILKEGTHQLPSPLAHLPDVDISIVGDGIDKTKVVPNVAGIQFFIYGNSSTYRFSDFTASYKSPTNPTLFISCNATLGYGGALETNTADLFLSNIKLNQEDSPTTNNEGILYRGIGKFYVEDCEFHNGERGISSFSNVTVVDKNIFSRQRTYSAYLWGNDASITTTMQVTGNEFNPLMYIGCYLAGGDKVKGSIFSNNTFIMNTATGAIVDILGSSTRTQMWAMRLKNLHKSVVSNNNFLMLNASKLEDNINNMKILYFQDCTNLSVTGNTVHASLNADVDFNTIALSASSLNNTITGNTIECNCACINNSWAGVYLNDSNRNAISDNIIKMSDRSADDGIVLSANTVFNYGRGNLVWDASDGVVDAGDNDVLATLN
jgi:hypothetical protein